MTPEPTTPANPTPQPVKTRTARIWLAKDSIGRYVAIPGAEVTLADAEEIHHAIVDLYHGDTHPLLVDIRDVKSASREARQYFAGGRDIETTTAVALLVRSPVSRVIGNFFLGLNKPQFPIRTFDSEADALAWLKGFL
jgi:hypothetical protein